MTLSPSSAPRPLGRYALALGRVPGRGLRCWGAGAGPMVYRWDDLLEGGGGAADGGGGGGGEEAREASVLWGHERERVLSTGRDGLLIGQDGLERGERGREAVEEGLGRGHGRRGEAQLLSAAHEERAQLVARESGVPDLAQLFET